MILNENQIDILLECQFLLSETTIKSHFTGVDFDYAKKLDECIKNIKTEKQREKLIKKINRALDEVDYFINGFFVGDKPSERFRKYMAGGENVLKIGFPVAALLSVLSVGLGGIAAAATASFAISVRQQFRAVDGNISVARQYRELLRQTLAKAKALKL